VLVLAVQAHEVDGRVFGEAVIVWPQSRPDIAVGRTDPFILGIAHVEIAEDDGVVGAIQCAKDSAQLPSAQSC
jgi:hypothetical protein